MPCAQITESTVALTTRPGMVMSVNSAALPGSTWCSSFWLNSATTWPSASTSVMTGLNGMPATNAPGLSARLIT